MNELLRRRRAMMEKKSDIANTSPKIKEYGKRLFNKNSVVDAADCCYTIFYAMDSIPMSRIRIKFNSTAPYPKNLVQSWDDDEPLDYGSPNTNYLASVAAGTTRIRFTLLIDMIEDTYAYNPEDGQIFFAGRNTPYYGYKNINDMPQG